MDKDNRQDIKINTLEVNYSSMSEQIKDLKTTVNKGFNDLKQEFKCLRDESDKKYASKNVEVIVYGLVSLILIAFAGGLITLVIK